MAEQKPTTARPTTQTQPRRQRGQGRIFKRKGTAFYWCAYFLRGKEHRESTGKEDEKQAESFLKHRLKEIGADQIGAKAFIAPQQQRIIVSGMLDALKKDYELRGKDSPQFKSHLSRVRDYFGLVRAIELTAEMVDGYIGEQLEDGFRPATINRGTQLLRQAYKLAIARKHLHSAPSIRRLDESDNVRQGYLEDAEFRRVVRHLPEYLQDFAVYSYLTGWRRNSVEKLRWAEVQGDVIFLPAKYWKGREPQTMPIEGEIAEIIERRRVARAVRTDTDIILADFVFHRDAQPIGDFRKAWKTACKLAGVSGRLFHDLCRCCARNLDKAGVPRRVAMDLMGRKTESIYARYRIVDQGEKRVALLRLQEYLRSAAGPTDHVSPMLSAAIQ